MNLGKKLQKYGLEIFYLFRCMNTNKISLYFLEFTNEYGRIIFYYNYFLHFNPVRLRLRCKFFVFILNRHPDKASGTTDESSCKNTAAHLSRLNQLNNMLDAVKNFFLPRSYFQIHIFICNKSKENKETSDK